MSTRFLSIAMIFIAGLLLLEPAMGQRNPYKKSKGRNKKVSKYRGSSRGGKFRQYEFLKYGINAMNYYGDLAPLSSAGRTDISFTRPGTGITYGLRLHQSFAVSANYNFGRIKGADFSTANRADVAADQFPRFTRNLSFRNDIHEFNIGGTFFFIPETSSITYSNPVNFYIFVGVGFFLHDPRGQIPEYDYQTYGPRAAEEGAPRLDEDPTFTETLSELGVSPGDWVKLRPLGTEGQSSEEKYKPFQLQIPINAGVEFHIPRTYFKIGMEFGFRYLFTDYLDDVSTTYAGLDTFENPLARLMSDRGAEPSFEGNDRQALADAVGYNLNIAQNNFGDVTYYYSVDVGSGIEESIRGNPTRNDFYFLTQLNIKFILPPNGLFKGSSKSAAKFR